MARSKKLPVNNWRYLSWSQMWLWENKPADFIKQYIYGQKFEPNEYMLLGKKVADCLETGDAGGDPALEHLLMFMQSFETHEHKISCKFEGIPLFMKLDGFTEKPLIIDEVKTGLKYSQSVADKNDQLTFYTIGVYVTHGRLPDLIRLHWAETERDAYGNLILTGQIQTFETKRTLNDILKFVPRMVKAWNEINAAAREEYKAIK